MDWGILMQRLAEFLVRGLKSLGCSRIIIPFLHVINSVFGIFYLGVISLSEISSRSMKVRDG